MVLYNILKFQTGTINRAVFEKNWEIYIEDIGTLIDFVRNNGTKN